MQDITAKQDHYYVPRLLALSQITNTHRVLKAVCFCLQVKTLTQPVTDEIKPKSNHESHVRNNKFIPHI
jgi:hypothetical protein